MCVWHEGDERTMEEGILGEGKPMAMKEIHKERGVSEPRAPLCFFVSLTDLKRSSGIILLYFKRKTSRQESCKSWWLPRRRMRREGKIAILFELIQPEGYPCATVVGRELRRKSKDVQSIRETMLRTQRKIKGEAVWLWHYGMGILEMENTFSH